MITDRRRALVFTRDACVCAPRRPEYEAAFPRMRQRTGSLSRRSKDSYGSPASRGRLRLQPSPRKRVHPEHPEAVWGRQIERPAGGWEHALYGDQQEETVVSLLTNPSPKQEEIGW